jgi:cytochrome c556
VKETDMKRALLSLACLLTLAAAGGGPCAQAGDGSTSTASSAGSDGNRPKMSPEIKADIQALKAARKQLKDDRESNDVDRLTADREAVKAAFKKLREDIAALRKERKPDA